MAPSMMESILMRKCQLSLKEAKQLTVLAKQQLHLSEESTLLWSKEYETKCIDIYNSSKCNKALSSTMVNNIQAAANGDSTMAMAQRSTTRPLRLQRHHSDSTDSNSNIRNNIGSNRNDTLRPQRDTSRKDQAPTMVERRKSRSLSKPRRKKSPAATRMDDVNNRRCYHHQDKVNEPERHVKAQSSFSSHESDTNQPQQQQRRRRRQPVPRKSSSSSTLSSFGVDDYQQPPTHRLVVVTTTGNNTNSTTGNNAGCIKNKNTAGISQYESPTSTANSPTTNSPIGMSPFSLNESIHSMTSPRRPQRQLSLTRPTDKSSSDSNNHDQRKTPTRQNSISSKTFQTSDAVIHTPNEKTPRGRRDSQERKEERSSHYRDRSKSTPLRRSNSHTRKSKPDERNDEDDDNDTTKAQSPISTSILRRSNRWSDTNPLDKAVAKTETTTSNQRRRRKESASPVRSKRDQEHSSRNIIVQGGSGRDNSKKSFSSDLQRLNRSLSHLHVEESKKNQMYSLPTPLTPTEGSVRPKFQPKSAPTKRTGSARKITESSSNTTTDRWSSNNLAELADRVEPISSSSPISRPKINKLTKSEENFFDSFRSNNTNTTIESQSPTTKQRRSEDATNKSNRPKTAHSDKEKDSSRIYNIDVPFNDSTSTPTKKSKTKSTTTRRRLTVEEMEKECQADPKLRNAVAAAANHLSSQRPSKTSHTNDDVTFRNKAYSKSPSRDETQNQSSLSFIDQERTKQSSNEDNQTVSTGSGNSTKSKTRLIPVVKSKTTMMKRSEKEPVSPSKRVLSEKKIYMNDPSQQSPHLFENRMTAAYKNVCESPLKEKATMVGNKAPSSPSKIHMIPMNIKSPTQRMSPKKIPDHHQQQQRLDLFTSGIMKDETISPSSNKSGKHSVTSRTTCTTNTSRSGSSRESDNEDWYKASVTQTSNDLPKFHDTFHVASENDVQITEDQIFPEFAPSRFARSKVTTKANHWSDHCDNNDENSNKKSNVPRGNNNVPILPNTQSPQLLSDRAAKYKRMLQALSNENNRSHCCDNLSMLGLDDTHNTSCKRNGRDDCSVSTGAPKQPQRRKSTIIHD